MTVTGTGAASIEIVALPAAPPFTYLGVANALIDGARALYAAEGNVHIALALVSSHALECLLKAYLSGVGLNEKELKAGNLRHNLKGLWKEANARGMEIDTEPPMWVNTLSSVHDAPYQLRYSLGVHGIALPPVIDVVNGLNDLLLKVKAHLNV